MRRGLSLACAAASLVLFILLFPAVWRNTGLSARELPDFARVLARAPWPGAGVHLTSLMLSDLAALGFWALLLLGGLGSARWLAPANPTLGDRVEAALLCWGALGGISFLLFAARLGVLVAPVSIAACLLGAWGNSCLHRRGTTAWRRYLPQGGYECSLMGLALASAGMALASAPMPVHQSDALAYHAMVPRAYVNAGRLVEFPYNIRAHFPMLAGMLSAPGLALGVESAPRLVHAAFFCATLLLVYDLAAGWANRRAGLWAAAAAATVGYAPRLAAYGFVDYAATAFALGAVRGLLRLAEQPGDRGRLLRIALLCGMAAATKLNLALSLLPVPMAAAVLVLRGARAWRALALAALLGLLPLAPWWIHNGLCAGNPCLPFLAGVFPSPEWSATDALIYRAHAQDKGGLAAWRRASLPEKAADLLTLPVRATLAPLRNRPDLPAHPERWMGDWPIGPLPLAGLPLLLLLIVPGTRRGPRAVALLSLWFYLTWAISYRDLRFLLPFLSLYLTVLAAALHAPGEARPAAGWLTLPGLAGQAAIAGLLALGVTAAPTPAGRAPLGYVLGFTGRDDFLADKVPDNFTPALRWLAQHAQARERVLLVGLNHGYHLPYDCVIGDFFSPCPLLLWAREAGGVPALEARLEGEGITAVVWVGENLANPGYAHWFFLHALDEAQVRDVLAGRGPDAPARAEATDAYRRIAAWRTASRRLARIYPPVSEPVPTGAGPWGLPARTLIYATDLRTATEPTENTHLKQ